MVITDIERENQAYRWGTISTLVVCLLSLGGVLFYPVIRKTNNGDVKARTSRSRWMMVLIAMAAATLSADALLHLVPQGLGLHGHGSHDMDHDKHAILNATMSHHDDSHEDHEDHGVKLHDDHGASHGNHTDDSHEDHDDHAVKLRLKRQTGASHENHTDEHDDHDDHEKHDEHDDHDEHDEEAEEAGKQKTILFKMSALMLAVYVLYVFEFVSQNRNRNGNGNGNGHGHSHTAHKVHDHHHHHPHHLQPPETHRVHAQMQQHFYPSLNGVSDGQPVYRVSYVPTSQDNVVGVKQNGLVGAPPPAPLVQEEKLTSLEQEQDPICFGLRPIALTIIAGDAIHNLCDGLAMGAAFSMSVTSGLATSIAVVCHELPHEIGDFAVLIDSGLSVWKALMMNLLSALTAFAGLYIGIAVGAEDWIRQWLFVFTAGMFLYVAWVDMLAFLKAEESDDPWFVNMALQNLGFMIGFVLIFLLGWFEHGIAELLEPGAAHGEH